MLSFPFMDVVTLVFLGLKSCQAKPVIVPDESTFDKYYNGCCNGTFWPLFHSMPDRTVFDLQTWRVSFILKRCFIIYSLQSMSSFLNGRKKYEKKAENYPKTKI